MTVTINGTTGITTPGVTNSGAETVASTLAVTGAITGSGLTTTLYPLVSGTAVASTSGTSIDFTSIPSWVKRITVMFNGVSTSGTSAVQIQLGSTTFSTTGYFSCAGAISSGTGQTGSTTGLLITQGLSAASAASGSVSISLLASNVWTYFGTTAYSAAGAIQMLGGNSPVLGGTLDRVRITTVNGTDTFDAGSINILYE